MIALRRPYVTAADLHSRQVYAPGFWDEAIVDVVRLQSIPLEIERGLRFRTVRFTKKVMICTHKAEGRQLPDQATVVLSCWSFVVPDGV